MDNIGSPTSQSKLAVSGDWETVPGIADNSTTTTMPLTLGAVALGLIVLATVFGNVLLCLAVITDRRLQNMTNYFLASLAVADLLVAVLVMPPAVLIEMHGQSVSSDAPVTEPISPISIYRYFYR